MLTPHHVGFSWTPQPSKWRHYFPSKFCERVTQLHNITWQKTWILIKTAVKQTLSSFYALFSNNSDWTLQQHAVRTDKIMSLNLRWELIRLCHLIWRYLNYPRRKGEIYSNEILTLDHTSHTVHYYLHHSVHLLNLLSWTGQNTAYHQQRHLWQSAQISKKS